MAAWGNLHTIDLYIQAHQVALRNTHGVKEIDRFLTLGSNRVWAENVTGLSAAASIIAGSSTASSSDAALGGVPEPFRMGPQQCAQMGLYALDAGIIGAMFGLAAQPEAAAVFGALALTFTFIRFPFC